MRGEKVEYVEAVLELARVGGEDATGSGRDARTEVVHVHVHVGGDGRASAATCSGATS